MIPEQETASPSDTPEEIESLPTPLVEGLRIYIGTTEQGKTYKAFRDALVLARRSGKGLLIVDTIGEKRNLANVTRASTHAALIEAVWKRRGVAKYTPLDHADFEGVIGYIKRMGNAIVLIDEVSPWARNERLHDLTRIWSHREIALLLTCQHVGSDLAQTILACNPTLVLFKATAPRTIEWMMRHHGIDPVAVRNLAVGQYIEKRF